MTDSMTGTSINPSQEIEVSAEDLPLHCPTNAVALWCSHPRVFLDIGQSGKAMCPYCGTRYRLKPGAAPKRH